MVGIKRIFEFAASTEAADLLSRTMRLLKYARFYSLIFCIEKSTLNIISLDTY